ncbi:MAG TPA: tyrosine--tRNA ligase [Phycisphaerales bacterium]|nr:tyrosine--tRNA ligase [Phycisphaerales bacterium]
MTTPDLTPRSAFLNDMLWRGQINQGTDLPAMDKWLCDGDPATKKAYVGFDPTADSLTIGNLVGIMTLARWQQAGHTPVALMGGATGLIGDPSGKSAERTLNSEETVRNNVKRIATIFAGGELFNSNATTNALKMVNNIDWLGTMGFLEALREIGKHFSVNMMIQKDSVKARLESREQGISYTEFSYMLLQAYDFFWLHKHEHVATQMGGSDQFGNIVVGKDLIDKKAAADASHAPTHSAHTFGLTWPLVTKADGTKFGKTESGAIWLKADRTSPYAYYQFWLNAADADVVRFLKTFTFLKREEVEALAASQQANPGAREAQRALAREATRILHGKAAMENAEAAGKALFSGEVAGLDLATLRDVFANVPNKSLSKASLEGDGIPVLDILVDPDLKLAASKREARDFLTANAVTINGKPVTADSRLTTRDLLHNCFIAIRRGKKQWAATEWK